MVEINNQRKAFLDMLASVVRGTDNETSEKPEIMDLASVMANLKLFADYKSAYLRHHHAKPKTQINRRGRYQLLSRWWDAYRKAA